MTPYEKIKYEERHLKEQLIEQLEHKINEHVQDFIDKTGLTVGSISFNFMDVSTFEKKGRILYSVSVHKESII